MKKESKGITLIALVITIIVLLILAGVTIQTLTGDNGLLIKVGNAKEKNEESKICEQIKLAYLDYEMAKFNDTNLDGEEYLTNSLKQKLNDNTLTIKINDGKAIINTIVTGELKTYIYKINTGESFKYVDPFDYKGKEKKEIEPDDDILIGTEKFKVFYNKDGVIKAMPYYNLVMATADGTVKQGPAVSGTSTLISSTFSTEPYWTRGTDEIDMSDSRNNIQQYIAAYKTTLEKLGAEVIEVRAGKNSELNASNITNDMRNPGQTGSFRLGSGGPGSTWHVYLIKSNGDINGTYNYNGTDGVRPIIIIPIE